MGRYRKILVAIDGSPASLHALEESLKLAQDEKSWVTVVSVAPKYEGDLSAIWVNDVKKSMTEPCQVALSRAKKIAEGERALIKPVCEQGEIYERIVDLADAENCDLIVMGKKGYSQIQNALIGNVTARVIGHSQRDVLVVPKDSSLKWGKILVVTDGSKYSQLAVDKAIEFAKSYGSHLSVLCVVDVTQEFFAQAPEALESLLKNARSLVEGIKERASAEGITADVAVREGEPYKIIVEVAKKEEVGGIIIGSHGRTGLRRLLMGSVTAKVIGYAPCPVLVVKS